jgi:hypothetical protein
MSFYFDPDDATGTAKRREAANALENQRREAERLRRVRVPGADPYQAEQQQGINPMQAYDMYSKFAGGGTGSGAMVGGSTGSGTIAAGSGQASATGLYGAKSAGVVGSAAQGGGTAAGAGSSFGSAAAAALPWAALVAAAIANESKQRGDDNRGNSTGEHIGDIASGKVLERDAERYLAHNKAGGATKRALIMGTPSGAVRNTKDLWGWTKGLFD